MDATHDHNLSEQHPYIETLNLIHPTGLCCPNGHHVVDPRKNIHKRDPKGVPRYRCSYPGCSVSFNIFTNTPLQGTSFNPAEVITCVNGILEKKDIKELSNDSGVLERRLKKYYEFFISLSKRKRLTQLPILKDWEEIFAHVLTTGEANLPRKDYHHLKELVFHVLKTVGSTALWKNLLEDIADWNIIDDFEEKHLMLTMRNNKQYKLKKLSIKEIDPKTGRTKSTKRFTHVSIHRQL